jgi:hypothetical protein
MMSGARTMGFPGDHARFGHKRRTPVPTARLGELTHVRVER